MMKKWQRIVITLLLVAAMLAAMIPTAMAASASLNGSNSVQAGNSVTLTLSVSGSIYGLSGKLNVGDNMTFTNYNCSASGWTLTVNGTNFSAYGTSAASGAILTVTLKVNGSASVGSALSARFSDILVSDGNNDTALDSATWSGSVGAAPSGDNTLSSIVVTNATLNPAFSKDVTYYTCIVPYSVDRLNMDYFRNDQAGARAEMNNPSLSVGDNTVTIKVTAANGAVKTYTIVVTRQQDPNYKPAAATDLKSLTLSAASLSPVFSADCTDYVAYVPYETQSVTLSGEATDSKASVSPPDVATLTDAVTDLSVTCTAEDGVTKQTYTVHVFRMPEYDGVLPAVSLITDTPTDTDVATMTDDAPFFLPSHVKLPLIGEVSTLLAGCVILGILVILLFIIGILIGRNSRDMDEEEPIDNDEPLRPLPPVRKDTYRDYLNEPEPKPVEQPAVKQPERKLSDEQMATKKAEEMSLDDLLRDIRNM